nr:MAG TPA: hypothetical protein [Caudoviricetes sp.]
MRLFQNNFIKLGRCSSACQFTNAAESCSESCKTIMCIISGEAGYIAPSGIIGAIRICNFDMSFFVIVKACTEYIQTFVTANDKAGIRNTPGFKAWNSFLPSFCGLVRCINFICRAIHRGVTLTADNNPVRSGCAGTVINVEHSVLASFCTGFVRVGRELRDFISSKHSILLYCSITIAKSKTPW